VIDPRQRLQQEEIHLLIWNRSKRTASLLIMLAVVLLALSASAQAQTPAPAAIAYQGELNNGELPAEGFFDFEFKLFDSGGNLIDALVKEDVEVLNGLFWVELDLGETMAGGESYMLEMAVRAAASTGDFTPLAGRMALLAGVVATDAPATAASADAPTGSAGANTYGSDATAPANAVYVRADGNTGVGVTNPLSKLHVAGSLILDPGKSPILFVGNSTANLNRYLQLVNSPQKSTAAGLKTGGLLVADSYAYANPAKSELIVKGNVGIGTNNPQAKLDVQGAMRAQVVQITGGDLAEPFVMAGAGAIQPGMVVAIDPDHPGQLRISTSAYDRTVAGVVSGAGGIDTGVLMYEEAAGEDAHPVALSGRVYVYADAANGAIEPGDLLTTASTPGHAMKATNYEQAQGAILGKAMGGLESGRGLVLMLVTLQ
jgi:hypothetical protein